MRLIGRVAVALSLLTLCRAFPSVRLLMPNGFNVVYQGAPWPGVGHLNRGGGGPLNPFGLAFEARLFNWNAAFCNADADGDGFTNGQELGDPTCRFLQINPSAFVNDAWTLISHPGFNDSTPLVPSNTITSRFSDFILGANLTAAFDSPAPGYLFWSGPNQSLPACNQSSFGRFACDLSYVAPRPRLDGARLNISSWVAGLTSLIMENQMIQGTFSFASLQLLPIKVIDLSNNSLTGILDFTKLPSTLEYLDLSFNQFTGSINLTNVTFPASLRVLNLAGNAFSFVGVDVSRLPSRIQVSLPSVSSQSTLLYTCGSPHAEFSFTYSTGTSVLVPAGSDIPSPCLGCLFGEVYDLATPTCARVSTPLTPQTPAPQLTGSIPVSGSVRKAADVVNYCDEGCTTVLVLLLLFLIAAVIFALVFKCCYKPKEEPQEVQRMVQQPPPTAQPVAQHRARATYEQEEVTVVTTTSTRTH